MAAGEWRPYRHARSSELQHTFLAALLPHAGKVSHSTCGISSSKHGSSQMLCGTPPNNPASIHTPVMGSVQILALIGLRARERLVAANLELIEGNLAEARAFFKRHSDTFDWCEPAASSIAFPRLKTGEDVGAFCERLAEKAGEQTTPDNCPLKAVL